MLLANTPTQAETEMHRLEKAASGIGGHVKADKNHYQRGDISTLKSGSLKLLYRFI